ncbi:MAG: hypothetical protein ACXAC0_07670 [Candidatus Thorarchaeota archaeon]
MVVYVSDLYNVFLKIEIGKKILIEALLTMAVTSYITEERKYGK